MIPHWGKNHLKRLTRPEKSLPVMGLILIWLTVVYGAGHNYESSRNSIELYLQSIPGHIQGLKETYPGLS
jgi:hypothetical protein